MANFSLLACCQILATANPSLHTVDPTHSSRTSYLSVNTDSRHPCNSLVDSFIYLRMPSGPETEPDEFRHLLQLRDLLPYLPQLIQLIEPYCHPVVQKGLTGAAVLIHLYQTGRGLEALTYEILNGGKFPYVTFIISGIAVFVRFLPKGAQRLLPCALTRHSVDLCPRSIIEGFGSNWPRLFSFALVPGQRFDLAGNLLSLWSHGSCVEQRIGSVGFASLCICLTPLARLSTVGTSCLMNGLVNLVPKAIRSIADGDHVVQRWVLKPFSNHLNHFIGYNDGAISMNCLTDTLRTIRRSGHISDGRQESGEGMPLKDIPWTDLLSGFLGGRNSLGGILVGSGGEYGCVTPVINGLKRLKQNPPHVPIPHTIGPVGSALSLSVSLFGLNQYVDHTMAQAYHGSNFILDSEFEERLERFRRGFAAQKELQKSQQPEYKKASEEMHTSTGISKEEKDRIFMELREVFKRINGP